MVKCIVEKCKGLFKVFVRSNFDCVYYDIGFCIENKIVIIYKLEWILVLFFFRKESICRIIFEIELL